MHVELGQLGERAVEVVGAQLVGKVVDRLGPAARHLGCARPAHAHRGAQGLLAAAQRGGAPMDLRANLLTYLLAYLLTYSLTHSLTYLLTYLLTYVIEVAQVKPCLLTHLLTYSLTYLLTSSKWRR